MFLPSSLAIIMFSLGLGLTYTDFTKILKQPKDFFLGAIYQPLLSQASDRALGRQRRHNFWPEGGEVRKFGLAIMAADRLLY